MIKLPPPKVTLSAGPQPGVCRPSDSSDVSSEVLEEIRQLRRRLEVLSEKGLFGRASAA
jgi:hypothetical protein